MNTDIAPLSITAIILTKDEAKHIERALDNIRDLCTRIVIVDSYSSDNTVELAHRYDVEVLQNPFINQAKQFQWALGTLTCTTDWILRLDADEILEDSLKDELRAELPALPATVVGVNLRRKHVFMGQWIRHGGRYPLILTRIWRNGHGRVEDRWMDEHVVVWGGTTVTMKGDFVDNNLNDLTFFTEKHNRYATREAIEILIRRHKLVDAMFPLESQTMSKQAALKRALKDSMYSKLPTFLASTLYFIYRYIGQLGFLDGQIGLIYHGLQGYWYRFLVGAKTIELEAALKDSVSAKEKRERLYRLTGYAHLIQ